jgi:hypothetical protein
MRIWVDADACPNAIKEILYRVAGRAQIDVVLVANTPVRAPASPRVTTVHAGAGFDATDRVIVERMETGDLVVTADVPLAAEVIGRGAHALNPRGELYTEDNVQQHLAVRNLMEGLRAGGEVGGGPAAFGPADRRAFADALDRFLARRRRA